MALTFYVVLMISGGNDVIADKFDISLNAMTWVGRIGVHRPAADRLRAHLPDLPGSAAARPRGARARHRDRRHPAPAARRVHRGAPAARPGRRARPRPARLRRRSGAEEDEPDRRRPPRDPGLLHADRGAGAGRARAARRRPRPGSRARPTARAHRAPAARPRVVARPTVALRGRSPRSPATDVAPLAPQQGPGGSSTGALLHVRAVEVRVGATLHDGWSGASRAVGACSTAEREVHPHQRP